MFKFSKKKSIKFDNVKSKDNVDNITIGFALRSFGTVLKLLFADCDWVIGTTLLIVAGKILSELLLFKLVQIPGNFVQALLNRDEHAFWVAFEKGLVWYACDVALDMFLRFIQGIAYFVFRRKLTNAMHDKYFSNRVYYKMNKVDKKGIDNPDQRMTDDIDLVVTDLLTYCINVVPQIVTAIVYFTYFVYIESGIRGVLIVYGYSAFAGFVNLLMLTPFTKWSARVQNTEADFRYKHVNVRDNAENVAMYNSESFERSDCEKYYDLIIDAKYWTLFYNVLSAGSNTLFDDFTDPIIYIVLSISIIYLGNYDGVSHDSLAATITTYAGMLSHLVEILTTCAAVVFAFSRLAGSTTRIYDFMCYTDNASNAKDDDSASMSECNNYYLYKFENVTYSPPDNADKILLKDFTLKVPENTNVIITGPSGTGKTSFLRIMAKLWPIKSGILTVNAMDYDIYPVPSQPYLPSGRLTLKQQIIFPLKVDPKSKEFDDQQIMTIIKELSLDSVLHLCNGLDSIVEFDWTERLSLGQQQRIAFARVLYHRPALALLDEATSCLLPETEKIIYNLLQKRGIACISTGNQSSLQTYHNVEVKLDGRGGYEVIELPCNNVD